MIALLPAPRELERTGGRLTLERRAALSVSGDRFALGGARETLAAALAAVGTDAVEGGDAGGTPLALRLITRELPDEGYVLTVAPSGIELLAGGRRGALHGARTLAQLLDQAGTALPCLRVRDWPDLARRGFMLDVSRDRVPTMAALRELVERMAALKMNVLQLYTEHTFAFVGHETVWRDASPLTPEEIHELDAHCAERGVELVPNQNSFGHMERWLRHPEYRHLGERPEGGSCLAPGEASIAFMGSLFDQLLPCFGSRRVNVGCDETFELGRGRSKALCEERGSGRVYLDYLLRLVADLHGRGRHVEFWGDIVVQHEALIRELPREHATALAWHYEAPIDPGAIPDDLLAIVTRFGWTRERLAGFGGQAPLFARSGVPFQVCPGTSSWNTFVGRWSNARANIEDAVVRGIESGAEGMLLTDWGDNGHLQPPVVSWPGLACGAALAWCYDAHREADWADLLGRFVFRDAALAETALDLGDAHLETGLASTNATPFFVATRIALDAEPNAFTLRGTPERGALERTVERIEAALGRLTGDDPTSRDLRQAARLARHGTWRLLRGRLDAGPDRAALARDLDELIPLQRERWLAAARPGGLADSLGLLERARSEVGDGGGDR